MTWKAFFSNSMHTHSDDASQSLGGDGFIKWLHFVQMRTLSYRIGVHVAVAHQDSAAEADSLINIAPISPTK